MIKARVVEDKKTRMVLELEGTDHTLCNSLKSELWKDSHVKISGYNIEHPLIGVPTLIVETDSSESPRKAVTDALKRLRGLNERFKADITKALR
jgi:DNA-directed RNA polymerase subunit L